MTKVKSANVGGIDVIYESLSGAMLIETSPHSTPGKEPKQVVKDIDELSGVAPWGSDNLFPQNVVKDIERSDLIPTVLEKKAAMLYSGGVRYGTVNNVNGKKVLEPINIPEIDNWLEETNISQLLADACSDRFTFYNIFFRLMLTADRSKIARVKVEDATTVRLGLQNSRGLIDKAFVSANWADGASAEDKETLKFAALDPYYNVAEQIEATSAYEYILPVRSQRRGRVYYELAPWDALRTIGWLDVAYYVPQFKKFLMENQMTLKYLIKIDDALWPMKFGNEEWKQMTRDKQLEAKKDFVQELVKNAKGTLKSGGALTIPKEFNQISKKYEELVTLEPLKQVIEGGEYVEDSQEADFHICRALGVAPTLVGITPGKGHNSGSGSDQRVARNNFVLDSKMDQESVMSALRAVSEYNGWNEANAGDGKRLNWWFENYFTATLDSGSGVQKTIEKANGDN